MKCPRCGENSPAPLTKHGCCYECASGHAAERHHVWGRANSPAVVEIPGNWHRALDAMRGERCEALKRPGIDPLHRIAAVAATIGESAAAFADHARRWEWAPWLAGLATRFSNAATSAADWLLLLAGCLADLHGADWAAKLRLPQWEPPQ